MTWPRWEFELITLAQNHTNYVIVWGTFTELEEGAGIPD